MFKNRSEAGEELAQKLILYKNFKNGIILALPRGGVVVADVVRRTLNLPLDIIVTRKIGAPENPEYAVAAVSENELIVSVRENPAEDYLKVEAQKERQEIKRRLNEYRGKAGKLDLQNTTVILIDDGLATGLTMEVAIKAVKSQKPQKIIIAVPVAPPKTIEKLKSQVDDIVVLKSEPLFFAVGQFYENFPEITDEEVKNILKS